MSRRRFTLKQIEGCQAGDILDMGVFERIDPREPDQGPNTVNVRLSDGLHYTETAGAKVRVWDRLPSRGIKYITISLRGE